MELTAGSTRTDAGVIAEDWTVMPLGSIAQLKSGYAFKSNTYTSLGRYSIVTIANVQDRSMVLDGCNKINALPRDLQRHHKLDISDILISMTGNVGRTCKVIAPDCLLNQRVGKLVPIGVDPEFLFSLLGQRQFIAAMMAKAKGGAQGNLSVSDILEFPVAIPPTKTEQEAIAEALSDADAYIESLEQLLAKKCAVMQGVMYELLTGKRRLPGFDQTWETKPLSELADVYRGASPRPIDSPVWFDNASRIGWVRIADVTESHRWLTSTSQYLSKAGIASSRFVESGNLIMSICATVGRPIITALDVCIHDGFVVFENPRIDRTFLYYALRLLEPQWAKHGQTGSQMNLNTGIINSTIIHVPADPEEAHAIGGVLDDMDSDIIQCESKLTKARDIKQGMMQQLLTGRVRLV